MSSYEPGVISAITGSEGSLYSKAASQTTLPSQAAHTSQVPRRDSLFLVLAPVMSTDYPSSASSRTSSIDSIKPSLGKLPSESSESAIDMTEPAEAGLHINKDRRSSSTGSYGAFTRRFLKLGPVHGGGDPGVSDYVEIEEE
jgi:hypothetical protein